MTNDTSAQSTGGGKPSAPATLIGLTQHHRNKVIERALKWRMKNHKKILDLIKGHSAGCEPSGHQMFDPSRWSAPNWIWFSALVVERATRGMK